MLKAISSSNFIIRNLFNNETSANATALQGIIWELKHAISAKFECGPLSKSIFQCQKTYLIQEVSTMPSQKTRNYCPRPEELLNKRSKLIYKCGQANKFLLRIFKTNHCLESLDS